ncbi:DUF2066 domain-containing protein [Devosia sp.]|uniref:DUF2066 domain-containing protein n=1 Tax=Devosia sp. TaxID=1871048 RepID=UPI001A08D6F7|nr:DUF2066 domain-containing protein [Devosia sp.]MBE0578462.1 DUF2066 domain-containing protein [Devosia sp.]
MRFATREARWLRVGLAWTILALACGLPAQAADPYRVTGVPIDATAESATAARERALAEGQRRALERLIDRLVDPADREHVVLPDAAIASTWVASFEVADERRSAVRYLARLTVTFADQAIRDYLRQQGIAFADTPSPPILVLPVLQRSEQLYFGGANPWLAAWQAGTPEGLVQFVLPGDPADPADAITPTQAAAANDVLLEAVVERYSIGDALVAQFTEDTGGASASVRATWLGPTGRGRVLVEALPEGGESPAARYNAAVRQVAKWAEDAWRRNNLVRSGEAHDFESVVPLNSLSDWIATRDGLARITAIHQVTLLSFARQEARILIRYSGDPDQLAGAISAQGLALTRVDDGWEITRAAAARDHGGRR